ncbi:MAG: FHA domain-containing protein [Planctomycetota bacterium]|nr:FHA domain-containing protein [Planctomycetota bacterium]MDA0933189.1 FHA domain-containing protein [Planctomycetota bacterium]
MNRYVLEVLDGDQAGTVVELGAERLVLGRRPDAGLVLRDEKCSGHHAEVVLEDGRHVLRDLGSTNGTTLDSRRVTEVVLSAGDVFSVGRVRIVFRSAEAPASAGGDAGAEDGELAGMALGRVDMDRLRSSGRRRGSLLWTVLFVLVVAVGGWYAWQGNFAGEQAQGPPRLRPMSIPGNRLSTAAADFEADGGWNLQGLDFAAPFDLATSRARAHSGTSALVAAGFPAEDGVEARNFAFATLAEPIPVSSGQPIEVVAHVRTVGNGRALVRVAFEMGDAEADGGIARLRTGSAPIVSQEAYQEVRFAVRAPRGAVRASLELFAYVPTQDDEVYVDDVALLASGDAVAVEGVAGGASLNGAGASVRLDEVELPTILGVQPMVGDDPMLGILAKHGLLVPSDAGLSLQFEALPEGEGFRLSWTGGPVRGLAVELPPESADCRVRGESGSFLAVDPDFESAGVRQILCGTDANRAVLVPSGASSVRGELRSSGWVLELSGATSFDVEVAFTEETVQARDRARQARYAAEEGRAAEALSLVDGLVRELPHDAGALRDALAVKAEVLAAQEREVEKLLRDAAEAEFFDARVGYQRIASEVQALTARYGADNLIRRDEIEAAAARMEAGIAVLDVREGRERAEMLTVLADAFEQVGNGELAKFVRNYVERLPKPDPESGDR